jgi:hypothetical protein
VINIPWREIDLRLSILSCSTTPSHLDITVISDDEDVPSPENERTVNVTANRFSNLPLQLCPGFKLNFPPGQQPHTSYPFGLHSLVLLPWYYGTRREGFFLTSHACTGMAEINGRCHACNALGQNENLQNIIARYTDGVHENATLAYHGIGGLIDLVHRKTSVIDVLRLRRLNDVRKLVGKEGVIEVHKQMLMALSTHRIPRIDRVLRRGFRNGAGLHSILELIKKAAEGTYHPKAFDEEEDLQALLFLRLGGARVADIAHRVLGTPSVSTIRTRTSVPQILPSPSFPTRYEVQQNIASTFEGFLDVIGNAGENMLHAIVMFDELAVERRPRWDDKSNKILGMCREHGCATSLEFTSQEDLAMLWDELESGKIHLAHEVRTFQSRLWLLRSYIWRSSFAGNCWCNCDPKPIITAL